MELNKQYSEKATNLLNHIHGGICASKNNFPHDAEGLHIELDLNVYGLEPIEFDILVSDKNDKSEYVKNKIIEATVAMSRYLVDNYNF